MTPGSSLDLILGGLFAFVLSLAYLFVVPRLKNPPASQKILFIGFVSHLFSSIGFVIFMKTYYGYLGDALFYFNTCGNILKNITSKPFLINELLWKDLEDIAPIRQVQLFGTTDPEVIYMARFSLPFYVLGMGLFTPTSVLIAILPFTGKYLILKAVKSSFPVAEQQIFNRIALITFLLPTALFWGTTILKESFLMFALGLLFISIQLILSKRFILPALFILIAFHLIASLKIWVLYVFLLALFIAITLYILNIPRIKQDFFLRIATILVFFIVVGFTMYFGVQEVIQEIIDNFLKIAYGFQTWHVYLGEIRGQSSYTLITIPNLLEVRWWQFVIAFPEALFTALYRPFIFEIDRFSEALVLPENIFLLYLSFKATTNFRSTWNLLKTKPILLTGFIFGIISLYIVGLVSFNFGAMVRYRFPGLITLISTFFFAYFYSKHQFVQGQEFNN